MNFSTFLSLIFQAKITGAGRLGRGRIYVKLMQIIADYEFPECSGEINILQKFNYNLTSSETYASLDKMLNRYIKTGKGYPYELFSFRNFEKNIRENYKVNLVKMKKFCDEVFDNEKLDSLVYTMLEILNHDNEIRNILYGCEYIPKEKLFGSSAHPKYICIEALLTGLLYHTHNNISGTENNNELLKAPERLSFHIIRYKDEKSLDLEMPANPVYNICENARHQKSAEIRYQTELKYNNITVDKLPEKRNIFLYGTGGAGKTTFLLNQLKNENTVNFYFPLYQYRTEIHESFNNKSCWILLQILLKYHYQYEYQTYEALTAGEEEKNVLNQLTELEKLLKNNPEDWKPAYTLLLDGLNEMSYERQSEFIDELDFIYREWKNVNIIVAGRTVPDYDLFSNFECIEVGGITDDDLDRALSENNIILKDEKIRGILKNPMFLNMYIAETASGHSLNTRGEILDEYIMRQDNDIIYKDSVASFIIRYSLPFAVKSMFDICFRHEISRGELLEAIDDSFEFYLMNDCIYQNYIAPQKYNKNTLLKRRAYTDLIELILNNTGLLEQSETNSGRLHFVHQYFRDYFGARHILNLIESIEISYKYKPCKQAEMFEKWGITSIWYGGTAFQDGDEVYRLIGEICGDYRNIPSEDFVYHWTVLDSLLDTMREYNSYQTADNVIKTMSLVRNNIICDVDFSKINIPLFIHDIDFSFNGKYPCSFRKCIVPFPHTTTNLGFKNCDFTGAFFLDNEYREILSKAGAVFDSDNTRLMDNLLKKFDYYHNT